MSGTQQEKRKRTAGPGRQSFVVCDVMAVTVENPQGAVKTFHLDKRPSTITCDLLIAGGSTGGVAAALRAHAAAAGKPFSIVLLEETDWLGGQMTSQGVSALDENYLVETSGANRSYQDFRTSLRDYYRTLPGVSATAAADERLNPGNNWVTRLSFEPTVGIVMLNRLLKPLMDEKQLRIDLRTKVVAVKVHSGRIQIVTAVNLDTGEFLEIRPRIVLDATELGDLLPLAGIPYSSGAESRAETGEAHAPADPDYDNVQDFTYPFACDFADKKNKPIAKPNQYQEFIDKNCFSLLGYKFFGNAEGTSEDGKPRQYLPFWEYRRLVAAGNYPKAGIADLAMINWESNDLRGYNIVDKPPQVMAEYLAMAKNLSLGFLHWMQTELTRDDGGKGYAELVLRPDVMGTSDGLSKYPYIRECRRLKARTIVTEQDIAAAVFKNNGKPPARARHFDDTVGIGLYPIDIHGRQDVPGAGQSALPFQIPLSSMIPAGNRVRNLIPACKNIGTTHVTNGAYRLHPIEWAIGEAAGLLAWQCATTHHQPAQILATKRHMRRLQLALIQSGIPLIWFDDVPTSHEAFEAIQYLSLLGIMPPDHSSMNFRPDAPVSKEDALFAVSRLAGPRAGKGRRANVPALPNETMSRAAFASWLYATASRPYWLGRF